MKREDLQSILREMKRDYTVVKRIGEGAFGEVWLLRDNALNRAEVVKTIEKSRLGAHSESLWKFEFAGVKAYAKKMASHPNLISVHDAVETDSCLFYFMEAADNAADEASGFYIPSSLLRLLNRLGKDGKRLPPDEVKRVMLGLLDGVEALHARGLQHRDIKLENIVFINGAPKLTDVGGVAERDERNRMVSSEVYTPHCDGKEEYDPVDHDLYALGKILYACLTGNDPADFPGLPDDFLDDPLHVRLNAFLVKSACSESRESRCRTVADFRERFLKAWNPPRRFLRRKILVAGGIALVAGAILCFLSGILFPFSVPAWAEPGKSVFYGDASYAVEKGEARLDVRGDQRLASALFVYRDLPPDADATVSFELFSRTKRFALETCFYSESIGEQVCLREVQRHVLPGCRWLSVEFQDGRAEFSTTVVKRALEKLTVLNPPPILKDGWNLFRVTRRRGNTRGMWTVEIFMNDWLLATQQNPKAEDTRFCMYFNRIATGSLRLRRFSITPH